MKTLKQITVLLALVILFSCQKDDDLNKLPSAPVLESPENGAATGFESIIFKWQESTDPENDDVRYILLLSKDSVNWESFSYVGSGEKFTSVDENSENYYPFEAGKKYYWKVKVENSFHGVDIPEQEAGESISEIFHFFTAPNSLINLRDTSGHEFVNMYWQDPLETDYVEIRFEPTITGISQPVKVEAGVQKYELSGLENTTKYTFYLKAYNNRGHSSQTDTVKALPLDPTQVHDADFNIYNITTIGQQTWLRENLRTTTWQDGTPMVRKEFWDIYKIGSQSDTYGYYYHPDRTFGESAGYKNPCPCGFHVPSDEEWKELERFLGMSEDDINEYSSASYWYRGEGHNIGNILKSTSGWPDNNGANGNGIDFYQFNLLPAGWFDLDKYWIGKEAILYSSTLHPQSIFNSDYICRVFSYKSSGIARYDYNFYGSIRCVKD